MVMMGKYAISWLTICGEFEIFQKVVRERLLEIHTVDLKSHKGHASEDENPDIYLAH
jgi:hypothetical protein